MTDARHGSGFVQRLKRRKVVEWTLAYLAGAWVVFEATGTAAEIWEISPVVFRSIHVLLFMGLFGAVILAWYHGEKGQQRVSGPELTLLAVLFLVAGGVLSALRGGEGESDATSSGVVAINAAQPLTAIAVLPFQNLSPDGPGYYFAGGLHDELLTQLAKVTQLKIISRTSVMGYAGPDLPSLRQIGMELGVGSVVEGSVQVAGDRLRVNVQLIDAATDEHVWAESYDRTLDDAFAIQSDVAQRVVEAVGATLGGSEQQSLTHAPTTNAEAYRLYLQGMEYMRRPGMLRQNIEIAEQLFQQALTLDSTFALAHAEDSQAHGQLWWYGYDRAPERLALQWREAEAALHLDPDLPQAHIALGTAHYNRRDWEAALREYRLALQALPNDANLWARIGYTHRRLGNWSEVEEAHERATQLDPRNADFLLDLGGYTFFFTRRYADGIAALDRALTLAPDAFYADILRGRAYLDWTGELDTLRAALDRLPPDAESAGTSAGVWRAHLLLWEGNADSLLTFLESIPDTVLRGQVHFLPISLVAAWGQELRGDWAAARASFDSARVLLDSVIVRSPDDWRVHAARGLALAGLGRREGAVQEARWLQRTDIYREDANDGTEVGEEAARILAQAGELEAALDEIERLLARPSHLSIHQLRLDPRWDPLRDHPRFQALVEKYSD